MNYIEELEPGQAFIHKKSSYVLTSDFKKNGDRLCVSPVSGQCRWLGGGEMVDSLVLYTIDKDSNLVHLREQDANDTTKNI